MIRKDAKQHRLILLMIQLQELYAAYSQQQSSQSKVRLKSLSESIETLKQDLPKDIGFTFARLIEKTNLAIVPVSVTNCSACGMNLPISLVNHVKVADSLQQCPSCARFLYFPEGQPRATGHKTAKKSDVRKAGISRFSSASLMIPSLKGTSAEELLGEITQNLDEEGFIDNGDRLLEEALKREAVMSTAVSNGIAFPHVRGVEGGGLSLSVAIHRKGIKFGGTGKSSLTRIFFFMTIPTAASAFYLKLLAGLSESFHEKEARDALIKAKTPEDMWKVMQKLTKRHIA